MANPGRRRAAVTAWLEKRTSEKPLCLFVGTSNPHVGWPDETSFDPTKMVLPPTFVDTPDTRKYRAMYCEEVKELDELLAARTACDAALGRFVGCTTYPIRDAQKVVLFWQMTVTAEHEFVPSDEVDQPFQA